MKEFYMGWEEQLTTQAMGTSALLFLKMFAEWTGERFNTSKSVFTYASSYYRRVGLQFKHFAGGFKEKRLESKKQNEFLLETGS